MAAEVGHLALAYDYAVEAALMDLGNLEHNTRDGLHMASLAGAWIALVGGFGGMRDHFGRLSFAPRLPDGITGLRFTLTHRGAHLHVAAESQSTTYTLSAVARSALDIEHFGDPLTLKPDEPVRVAVPPWPTRPQPTQPRGRAPMRRRRTLLS